jgi:hypothetical protein
MRGSAGVGLPVPPFAAVAGRSQLSATDSQDVDILMVVCEIVIAVGERAKATDFTSQA